MCRYRMSTLITVGMVAMTTDLPVPHMCRYRMSTLITVGMVIMTTDLPVRPDGEITDVHTQNSMDGCHDHMTDTGSTRTLWSDFRLLPW